MHSNAGNVACCWCQAQACTHICNLRMEAHAACRQQLGKSLLPCLPYLQQQIHLPASHKPINRHPPTQMDRVMEQAPHVAAARNAATAAPKSTPAPLLLTPVHLLPYYTPSIASFVAAPLLLQLTSFVVAHKLLAPATHPAHSCVVSCAWRQRRLLLMLPAPTPLTVAWGSCSR
jgi:hypothetical protein